MFGSRFGSGVGSGGVTGCFNKLEKRNKVHVGLEFVGLGRMPICHLKN
jgi:hypothetical protein